MENISWMIEYCSSNQKMKIGTKIIKCEHKYWELSPEGLWVNNGTNLAALLFFSNCISQTVLEKGTSIDKIKGAKTEWDFIKNIWSNYNLITNLSWFGLLLSLYCTCLVGSPWLKGVRFLLSDLPPNPVRWLPWGPRRGWSGQQLAPCLTMLLLKIFLFSEMPLPL